MKSKSNQKRIKRSFRAIKGGKPITESNISAALLAAQKCMAEVSTMMSNIQSDLSITESNVKTARLAAYELIHQIEIMGSIIKQEMTPVVKTTPHTSNTASSAPESQDSWKVGPNDSSGIGQGSIYADMVS